MIISSHKIIKRDLVDEEHLKNLIIPNPRYSEAERMGFSTRGINSQIQLYKEGIHSQLGEVVYIPRCYPYEIVKGAKFQDQRVEGRDVYIDSKIEPWEKQKKAIEVLTNTEDGILVAPCGSGKTVMALEAISEVGKTALILVNKGFLMEQWADDAKKFLGEEVGIVRGDTWDWKGRNIVVATLQTLYSRMESLPDEFTNWPGIVVGDEIHRISAPTFSQVVQIFPAKRRWGLTATPYRSDGLEVIFHLHMGEVVYQVRAHDKKPTIYMVTNDTYIQPKKYYPKYGTNVSLPKLITELTKDELRNRKILKLLINAAKAGRKILLLTDRVNHTKLLKLSFDHNTKGLDIETALYIGSMNKNERKRAEEADVIFATTQLAKEGLDIPPLDTLFLTCPTSSRITVKQAVGRILRDYEGKKPPLVVDIVDRKIRMAEALAKKRYRLYSAWGFDIKIM